MLAFILAIYSKNIIGSRLIVAALQYIDSTTTPLLLVVPIWHAIQTVWILSYRVINECYYISSYAERIHTSTPHQDLKYDLINFSSNQLSLLPAP